MKNERYVAITLTPELATAIAKAVPEGSSPGLYCRQVIANHLGVTIGSTRAAPRKYANTPEGQAAKKAALIESRKSHAAMVKAALAEYKAKHAAEQADQAVAAAQAEDAAKAAAAVTKKAA